MSDALKADLGEAKADQAPAYAPLVFRGVEYAIERKPNTLLLAELARTQSGDPEALGVLADFFESCLGKETYREFKRAVFYAEDEVKQDELFEGLNEIIEATLGRPTE